MGNTAMCIKASKDYSQGSSHSEHFDRSNTGVTNIINNGWIPFRCSNARAPVLSMLTHWLRCLNGTEPFLMLLVIPVLFLLLSE